MKIVAVTAELYIFGDEVDWERPIRLLVRSADGAALRLQAAGDGEGLIVEDLPLEPPMDLGEHGRTGIFDVADRLEPALRREALGEPVAIRNRAGRLIGLAWLRPRGERFCIWINGDEIRWGTEARLKEDYWADGRTPRLDGPAFGGS